MREQSLSWIAEHSLPLATVAGCAIVAWLLIRVADEIATWLRGRRQAALGCATCSGEAWAVAYPDSGRPLPYCRPCLEFEPVHKYLEGIGLQPPPVVPTARPNLAAVASAVLTAAGWSLVAAAVIAIAVRSTS